jgi:amidase
VRIGIPYKFLGEASKVIGHRLAAFGKIITLLEKAGAKIVWDVDIEGADVYQALPIESKDMGLLTHLKAATNTYLSGLKENPRDLKTLQDVIDFTKLCEAEEYPERNVAVLERAQATDPGKHSSKVMQEKDAYFAGVGGIPGTLDRYKLDVLLMPTLSVTIQAFAAKAGSPVISVPMGCYPAGTTIERDPNNGLITVAPNIPCVSH